MTDVSHPVPSTTRPERPLRRVLRANAAFSVTSGIVLVVAGGPIADLLDAPTWLIRVGGLGIAAFGLAAAAASRAEGAALVGAGEAFGIADAGWVVGSLAVVASGVVPGAGVALVLADAAIVGTVSALELRGGLAAPAIDPEPVI